MWGKFCEMILISNVSIVFLDILTQIACIFIAYIDVLQVSAFIRILHTDDTLRFLCIFHSKDRKMDCILYLNGQISKRYKYRHA